MASVVGSGEGEADRIGRGFWGAVNSVCVRSWLEFQGVGGGDALYGSASGVTQGSRLPTLKELGKIGSSLHFLVFSRFSAAVFIQRRGLRALSHLWHAAPLCHWGPTSLPVGPVPVYPQMTKPVSQRLSFLPTFSFV